MGCVSMCIRNLSVARKFVERAYTKPWGGSLVRNYIPDTELIEYICENEKDLPHMVGK
jgi:hypothetical protein